MNKAVFLDRDGVINELYYDDNQGVIDSPFHPRQFQLFPKTGEAINMFHNLGYQVIIISNQPGIAKKHFTEETFRKIREKMHDELKKQDAFVDAEYYCLHHPESKLEKYKKICDCRKPKPGMINQASQERNIAIPHSWMIGDSVVDIEAGGTAGCKTIFVGKKKGYIWEEMKIEPDYVVPNLFQASLVIKEYENKEYKKEEKDDRYIFRYSKSC
ncbi:MAG: D-glycero-alpha-D-manno-heptose-1,7-bisphosphate 7-phosphatase [Petrotogales bacterium]